MLIKPIITISALALIGAATWLALKYQKKNKQHQTQWERFSENLSSQTTPTLTFFQNASLFLKHHLHLLFKSTDENHFRIQNFKANMQGVVPSHMEYVSYEHLQSYQKRFRWIFSSSFTALMVLVVFFGVQIFNASKSKGATFGWMQTDWTGGADTANFPNHTSNQTGWTKFFSKDANVDVTSSSGNAKLTENSTSWTQTTNTDFSTGTTSANVAITGDGGGSLQLLKPTGAACTYGSECLGSGCMNGACVPACTTTTAVGQYCGFNGVAYGIISTPEGRIWLDRNLGAKQVATALNDQNSYGWLYQWGRLSDGHQYTAWGALNIPGQPALSGTTTVISGTDIPGHANFIKSSSDWRSPQNGGLWPNVNGISSPCPPGFRVPTGGEFGYWASGSSVNSAATAFSSTLKIPAPGYRSGTDASIAGQGSVSAYWTTDVYTGMSTPYSHYCTSFDSFGSSYVRQNAYGYPVRCIKN